VRARVGAMIARQRRLRLLKPAWGLVLTLAVSLIWTALSANARASTISGGTTSAAAGVLLLSPGNLQPQLPLGSTTTVAATPLGTVPGGSTVTFRVTGTNPYGPVTKQLTAVLPGLGVKSTKSATFAYSDTGGAGDDTVSATLTVGKQTTTVRTTIDWVPPQPCTDIGLPSLFRPLHCTAASHLLATAYDTGGCLAAFTAIGKLADAIRAASGAGDVVLAAGGSTSIAHLAEDLVELEKHGATTRGLIKAVSDAHSVKDLIQNIWVLVNSATGHGASGATVSAIAAALADLAGFGPCIALVQNTSAPAAPASTDRLLYASATSFRVGGWSYSSDAKTFDPSFAAIIAALGKPTSCRLGWPGLTGSDPNSSTAEWTGIGLRAEFTTYGGFPDVQHDNGCNSPPYVQIDNARVTGAGWHTAAGLRIHDSLARLRQLYPNAQLHPDGWWLQSAHAPYGGGYDYGQLRATVQAGTVTALTVQIDGEGD
jgi:hypothetical protein